jgi:hypothetical protein
MLRAHQTREVPKPYQESRALRLRVQLAGIGAAADHRQYGIMGGNFLTQIIPALGDLQVRRHMHSDSLQCRVQTGDVIDDLNDLAWPKSP